MARRLALLSFAPFVLLVSGCWFDGEESAGSEFRRSGNGLCADFRAAIDDLGKPPGDREAGRLWERRASRLSAQMLARFRRLEPPPARRSQWDDLLRSIDVLQREQGRHANLLAKVDRELANGGGPDDEAERLLDQASELQERMLARIDRQRALFRGLGLDACAR